MDRETFEQQKAFAGGKMASMKRRCLDHDYTERRMYMVTLVTEGRRKLFGEVQGRSDAPKGSAEAPHIVLSELGKTVERIWLTIADYHPEIKVLSLQMMPDHLHCILFVQRKMEKPLGAVILGVKQSCNKAYREAVGCVAVTRQHTQPKIEKHTQPEIEQHTQPKIEQHTQPKIEQHTQPEIEQHTQPEIEQHTQPEIEQHTQP